MNATATAANALWFASVLPSWLAFRRALHRPADVQATLLRSILCRAAGTEFGRAHRFDRIATPSEFAARVPVRDYGEFESWIGRIQMAEQRVLTNDRVTRLATTAGTTAARKFIPYTASFQSELNRAIGPWIVDLYRTYPAVARGRAYWSVSPVLRQDAERSVVPIGFEEDSQYLGGFRRRLVDSLMAVPGEVRHSSTIEQWRTRTIEHLVRCRDLRLISVWHPSFLSMLLDELPAPPEQLWPRLQVVSCWADGHATLAAEALQRRLPGVAMQPKGLIASEAIVSIPFAGGWPLAIRSHFFEFLDAEDGHLRLAHELKVGGVYEVLVTTSAGLYRYRLNDLIRVDGLCGRTPSIRFISKSGQISDRFGEKLSEAFVAETLGRLRVQLSATWNFAMLAPDAGGYVLFVEGDTPASLAESLDVLLQRNLHYAYCRDLRQLSPVRLFHILGGAEATYRERQSRLGQRLGDVKPAALSLLDGWASSFNGQFVRKP